MIYLVLVLTFGFTLLTSDIAIGRRTQESAIRAYAKMRPKWKFLGVLTFLVPVLTMTYYAVIGGWVTKYAVVYLTGQAGAAAEDGYFTFFITSPVATGSFRAAVHGRDGEAFHRKKLYTVMIRYVAPVMMLILFLQSTGILS